MFHVVLFAPEIPPNTGNAIRLCANTGARLHLVEPLGFDLSAAQLRRAGMDYAELAVVTVHADWAACCEALVAAGAMRFFALTTQGQRRYANAPRGKVPRDADVPAELPNVDAPNANVANGVAKPSLSKGAPRFLPNDVFVFGSETRGLPAHVLKDIAPENRLRLPLMPGNRSLNLSNTVAIVVYEAWRQQGFAGGA